MKVKDIKTEYFNKFIKVYDAEYDDGHHYYIASRRDKDDLSVQNLNDKPDAVSCFVIINDGIHAPKLLLQSEYRLPLNKYVLSVPAGLIEADEDCVYTAVRELYEETGINTDSMRTEGAACHIFPMSEVAYSSPGFTDESNAIVVMIIQEDISDMLTHKNAESNEHFGHFKLVTRSCAKQLLKDPQNKLPLMTYTALLYFVSGIWED